MNRFKEMEAKLRAALEGRITKLRIEVFSDRPWTVLVQIVSPMFEGMDEAERQAIVWQELLDKFTEADRRRIEFIYTDAPSEVDGAAEPEAEAEPQHKPHLATS